MAALKILLFITILSSSLFSATVVTAKKAPSKISIVLAFNFGNQSEAVQQIMDGINFARQDLIKNGSPKIDLIKIDTGSTAMGTRKALIEFFEGSNKRNIHFVIAELNSAKALVASDYLETLKIPMITPLSTADEIVTGKKFSFSSTFSNSRQAKKLADFSRTRTDISTILVVKNSGQLYSATLADQFANNFDKNKIRLESFEFLSLSNKLNDLMSKIKDFKPDLVFLPLYSADVARILVKAQEHSLLSPIYVSGDSWTQYAKTFTNFIAGAKLEMFWSSHWNAKGKVATNFEKRYRRSFNRPFNVAPAAGYDSLTLAVNAIIHSRKNGWSTAQSMRSGPPYQGVTGTIEFDDKNRNKKQVFIESVADGKIISPKVRQ